MNCYVENPCNYTLVIRQIFCQNGINNSSDSKYSNLSKDSNIYLNFGYTLTYVTGDFNYAVIHLKNDIYIPEINFTIRNGNFRIFNLPAENGTFIIYIAAKLKS